MQVKNSSTPKHFEIRTMNWIPNKEKAKDFNLIFSGKNRELEEIIARIVHEEVQCDKFIQTFLPAEFIGSKINIRTGAIHIPQNAKNGLNVFIRFLAWATEEGLIIVKDERYVHVISKNKVRTEKRAITKLDDG
ncbi:MAG: hypothetical protein JHC31_11845 [Sulfurihydrogenibium sp.]|jgi:hypothetical protein|nr:hypothetical protein [Sulfurihydrogenibium sp.]